MSGISGNHDNELVSENHDNYTPTTEEVREYLTRVQGTGSSLAQAQAEAIGLWFDRWLFHIQEDAWEAGYQAGVHDGRYDTVRETANPHTDWSA